MPSSGRPDKAGRRDVPDHRKDKKLPEELEIRHKHGERSKVTDSNNDEITTVPADTTRPIGRHTEGATHAPVSSERELGPDVLENRSGKPFKKKGISPKPPAGTRVEPKPLPLLRKDESGRKDFAPSRSPPYRPDRKDDGEPFPVFKGPLLKVKKSKTRSSAVAPSKYVLKTAFPPTPKPAPLGALSTETVSRTPMPYESSEQRPPEVAEPPSLAMPGLSKLPSTVTGKNGALDDPAMPRSKSPASTSGRSSRSHKSGDGYRPTRERTLASTTSSTSSRPPTAIRVGTGLSVGESVVPHRPSPPASIASTRSDSSWREGDDPGGRSRTPGVAPRSRDTASPTPSTKSASSHGTITIMHEPDYGASSTRPGSKGKKTAVSKSDSKSSVRSRYAYSESAAESAENKKVSIETIRRSKSEPVAKKADWTSFAALQHRAPETATPFEGAIVTFGESAFEIDPYSIAPTKKWRTLMLYPGQGGTFAYGKEYLVEDNNTWVTVNRRVDVLDARNKVNNSPWKTKHLLWYGQGVELIGTKDCTTCIGVYFEIKGNRVFCAHINAFHRQDRGWGLGNSKLVEGSTAYKAIVRQVTIRLAQHARYYGWTPKMVNTDSLRLVGPFKERAGYATVHAILDFLGLDRDLLGDGTIPVLASHGFTIDPPIGPEGRRREKTFDVLESILNAETGMYSHTWDDLPEEALDEVMYIPSTGTDYRGFEYNDNTQIGTWEYTYQEGWVTREHRTAPGTELMD